MRPRTPLAAVGEGGEATQADRNSRKPSRAAPRSILPQLTTLPHAPGAVLSCVISHECRIRDACSADPQGSRQGLVRVKEERLRMSKCCRYAPNRRDLYRRSKASADAQLQVVALEIVEIERARSSRHRAPDLNVPRRRDEMSLAEGRVESRADIERLPGETVEAEPVIVTKVARFRADEDVRHHLHRERRSNPEHRFAQRLAGRPQPR